MILFQMKIVMSQVFISKYLKKILCLFVIILFLFLLPSPMAIIDVRIDNVLKF